jgi:hypothetical protein
MAVDMPVAVTAAVNDVSREARNNERQSITALLLWHPATFTGLSCCSPTIEESALSRAIGEGQPVEQTRSHRLGFAFESLCALHAR